MDRCQQKRIKEAVRAHYAQLAQKDLCPCCDPDHCLVGDKRTQERMGYSAEEVSSLPEGTTSGFLGCGNPLAFSEIQRGDVVLDLGSGAGMDAILSAKRVGERGRVIGLDMTAEMIRLASRNAEKAGVDKVADFRLGEMEEMPIEDESVDWIISNCVINLSPDKGRVFREAYRVLKPGGKMLISDLVSSGLPERVKRDPSAWTACVAGTVSEEEYLALMISAGFQEVEVVERVDATDAMLGPACCQVDTGKTQPPMIHGIRVRAVKRGSDTGQGRYPVC